MVCNPLPTQPRHFPALEIRVMYKLVGCFEIGDLHRRRVPVELLARDRAQQNRFGQRER